MTRDNSDIEVFTRAIAIEAEALRDFAGRRMAVIPEVIGQLHTCRGRIVLVGMGKCGPIAKKLAATFASTGTLATFLHPAEALHGDLGFIGKNDVALILSSSGETDEITALLPHLKNLGIPILSMTGGAASTLARYSLHSIDTRVAREADPLGMAPTASTTLMLAIGDALASALMAKRGFGHEDYARVHPGGSIGQKLLCQVEDLMHTGKDIPACHEDVPLRAALIEMTSKRLGVTLALDDEGKMTGLLTDGDIRRTFQRDEHPLELPLGSVATRHPKFTARNALALTALRMMEDNMITVLPVLDEAMRPVGVLHIHDLIRVGIA